MIFAQMLEIVTMSDLASVLCAIKFSFHPRGGIYPQICPSILGFRKTNFYPIRINILGRIYYFVEIFGSKMRNFDAFLTGQPSY